MAIYKTLFILQFAIMTASVLILIAIYKKSKTRQKILIQKEKQLEAIIENMSDHCVVVDKAGSYIRLNKAAKDFIPSLQVKKVGDWLRNAGYYDIHGNELGVSGIPAAKVLNGETFTNYRIVLKNGTEEIHFDVNGTPVYDKGEFLFGIICSHDVTEVVKQSQEIERKWVELQTIFDNMSDAIYVVSKDGRYIFLNKAAKIFLPQVRIEKIGDFTTVAKYYDLQDHEILFENSPVKKVLRGEQVHAERMKMVYENTTRYISVSGTPIYNESGFIEYAVISSREITDLVEKENIIKDQQGELLRTEKEKNDALKRTIEKMATITQLSELNSLKDKLLTVVTHDVRNPMTTLLSLMELLEFENEHYCDYQEIIFSVKEQIKNTYCMVENLLEWLKRQKDGFVYNPLMWDLYEITQNIIQLYRLSAEAKNIQITSEIEEGMIVFADKEMLELVLRNLLSNAVKFTCNGVITIKAYESGNEIIIAVEDTGTGLDNEKASAIFKQEYFFSSSGTEGEKGAGLGLLICREFISRHGGRIWVDSTPGRGSTFCFSLLNVDRKQMKVMK